MQRPKQPRQGDDDKLELLAGDRPSDASSTAWLVGQGVHHLYSAGKEGELAYQNAIELLRDRKDAVEMITQLVQRTTSAELPLRWSFLYVLGDVADQAAADLLVRLAVEPLPEGARQKGCEGPHDAEILVRTMAVEALQQVATRHPEAAGHLLKIISERPARPILIEAVKAAGDLGLKEKLRDILQAEDHWILDIRKAPTEEIAAQPPRKDRDERASTPPRLASLSTAPSITVYPHKED